MPTHETFVTQLLRTYHGKDVVAEEQFVLPSYDQVRYLCNVGLGPIAFHSYGDMIRAANADLYSLLQGADLTIRVLYKQLESATVELLGSLQDVGVTPVLIKGISTANEFYSPPHLRLMGDVDILVKKAEAELTIAELTDLGYEIADEDWAWYHETGHHHLPGARHPKTGVTVEVHLGLFGAEEPFAQEPIFQPDSLEAQKLDFDYNGSRAGRFTPEFQLVFTIAKWAVDGNWAVNLTSINDAVHILRRHESKLNWSTLADWLTANRWLYANVAALMNYLEQANIVAIPRQMREALASTGRTLEPNTSRILAWLLHDYPFNARARSRDGYARWRAHALWQELTRPDSRDIKIPLSLLKTMLRSIHHGKYNPIRWLLNLYRYVTSSATRLR